MSDQVLSLTTHKAEIDKGLKTAVTFIYLTAAYDRYCMALGADHKTFTCWKIIWRIFSRRYAKTLWMDWIIVDLMTVEMFTVVENQLIELFCDKKLKKCSTKVL